MRILKIIALFLMGALLLNSCKKSNTYADYKEAEDEAIDSYISKNHIKVTSVEPQSDEEWMENGQEVFCHYTSSKAEGLYFHLCERGDGLTPEVNWTAFVRYTGTSMKGKEFYNCTSSYSPDPKSFIVRSDAAGESYGRGFQEAVKKLKVGGHCKVIIPFTIGNSTLTMTTGGSFSDKSNYQPMAYEIWLVGVE